MSDTGEHLRMRRLRLSTVPVAGVTMDECIAWPVQWGSVWERAQSWLLLRVCSHASRAQNLAVCRQGQHEDSRSWRPRMGRSDWPRRIQRPRQNGSYSGRCGLPHRYNINLNDLQPEGPPSPSTFVRRAASKSERHHRAGGPRRRGKPGAHPGSLKAVKGIGWYIEEYIAQLSLNLTDIHVARPRGLRRGVRQGPGPWHSGDGSELVGLLPLRVLLDAADHYGSNSVRSDQRGGEGQDCCEVPGPGRFGALRRPSASSNTSSPTSSAPLVGMTLTQFASTIFRRLRLGRFHRSYAGALGAALTTMVANLSAHKRGWDDRWETFSQHADGFGLSKRPAGVGGR